MKKLTCLLLGLVITNSVFAYRGCIIKLENHTGDPALVDIEAGIGKVYSNGINTYEPIKMAGGTSVTLQTTTQNNFTGGSFTLYDRTYTQRSCEIDYVGQFYGVPFGGLQINSKNCNIPSSIIVPTTPPCSGRVEIGAIDKAKIT